MERANDWAARLGCAGRVHFVNTNATISLRPMLASYPGRVELVAIQFPDPVGQGRGQGLMTVV